MSSISKRDKYLIILLMILSISYGYFQFFLTPILGKITLTKANIEASNAKLNNLNKMKNSNVTLNSNLVKIKMKYDDSLNVIPKFEKNPAIAYKLKAIADSNKVIISGVNMSPPTPYNQASTNTTTNSSIASAQNNRTVQNNSLSANPTNNATAGNIFSVPVTLNITGDYNSTMNFVSSIEKDNRLSLISNISLNSTKSADGKLSNINSTITINYFYISSSVSDILQYDFNKGKYGKTNLFN